MPLPKPGKKKKKDKNVKKTRYCEWCGSPKALLETHCIYAKGGSGPGYTPENTVTLCAGPPNNCHDKAQKYEISREELMEVVADRLGRTFEDIKKTLEGQRRK